MESRSNNTTSVKYHKIFDYKLIGEDFPRWQYKNIKEKVNSIKSKTRIQREKYSNQKIKIAKEASSLISKLPSVKFIGVTGSLSMMNSKLDSDIDLMIITKANTLWMTRLLCYMVIWLNGYKTRKPDQNNEKDKLCLNMWLDERDLVWDKKDRNMYTAHEIAQIMPLVNKEYIYEKFLYLNKWILEYWPKSVKILGYKDIRIFRENTKSNLLVFQYLSIVVSFIESFAFKLQYLYMSKKITREIVTPTRAIFHPHDWGKKVLTTLKAID